MIDECERIKIFLICCVVILATACSAQKQGARQDDWAMNNAMIGPDSPIEIRAGSFYQARAKELSLWYWSLLIVKMQ